MKVFPLLFVVLAPLLRADPLRCFNIYGLETELKNTVCSWRYPTRYYLEILRQNMNINTIRLPFSHEYVVEGNLTVLDDVISDCDELNFKIILDFHRISPTRQARDPDEGISRADFISTWKLVLHRYYNHTSVWGIGVFNELQCLDCFEYANHLYMDVIQELESAFPGRYNFLLGGVNWGRNLSHINISDHHRIFYEYHAYSFTGDNTPEQWDELIPQTITPSQIIIGEMGWESEKAEQVAWSMRFIDYLKRRNITNVCAWTVALSQDTEGWWEDDCQTFNHNKASLFNSIWN